MPSHFEFDSANKILRCRLEGQVTDEMLKEYYRLLEMYAAQTGPRAGILDMSSVTEFKGSTKVIRELANSRPALPDPSIPRCIVATSPEIYGIARMFELQGQDTRPNLHVVRTQKEALAILGVQEPRFEPIQLK
jgi:hypothetical protein